MVIVDRRSLPLACTWLVLHHMKFGSSTARSRTGVFRHGRADTRQLEAQRQASPLCVLKGRTESSVTANHSLFGETMEDEQLFLSAVTRGELQAGIELTRHQDPPKAAEIETWVDQLADFYQILPMDTASSREWGHLMDEKPDRLLEDAMIAATARVHVLIVATSNERDFKHLDVRLLNPFKPG